MSIPTENIPQRVGDPVLLEYGVLEEADDMPVVMYCLGITMTVEETEKTADMLRKKVEAIATLHDVEAPPEMLEALEEMMDAGGEHKAVVFGPYAMCWN